MMQVSRPGAEVILLAVWNGVMSIAVWVMQIGMNSCHLQYGCNSWLWDSGMCNAKFLHAASTQR